MIGCIQEFVDLYADWLLNRSVEAQFSAFRDGFYKVVNRSLLRRLCLPEEVEQLVCGVLVRSAIPFYRNLDCHGRTSTLTRFVVALVMSTVSTRIRRRSRIFGRS